jgi:hypothetical protein
LPFTPAVLEITDKLLLFRIDGDNGKTLCDELIRLPADVRELRVSVRRLLSLAGLANNLKAVPNVMEKAPDLRRADLMSHRLKLCGELVLALARPAKR